MDRLSSPPHLDRLRAVIDAARFRRTSVQDPDDDARTCTPAEITHPEGRALNSPSSAWHPASTLSSTAPGERGLAPPDPHLGAGSGDGYPGTRGASRPAIRLLAR
jgi:hypothetical protein